MSPRRLLAALLLAAALCPACAALREPSGRIEPLSESTCADLGCSPLLLAVYGREPAAPGERPRGVVGGGSGIAVHDRIILTAGHVVPEGARWVSLRSIPHAGETAPRRPAGARIQRVVRGGGGAVSEGDWALLILERPLSGLGIAPAPCLCPAGSDAPCTGCAVLIAGYPFPPGHASFDDMTRREPVLLRTRLADAPAAGGARATGDRHSFLYADYPEGRTGLDGLSGGPVFDPAPPGPPRLIGIHIASGTTRFGDLTLRRTAVIRRLPAAEIAAAIAALDAPP